jgi:hypothetical protein
MRAVIDRFEGGYALLLFGDQEINVELPRELLPPGAGEGDILAVSFQIDHEAATAQKNKIAGLLDKLNKNPSL